MENTNITQQEPTEHSTIGIASLVGTLISGLISFYGFFKAVSFGVQAAQAAQAVPDPGSHQAPPDHAGSGGEVRMRQQGCRADDLPVAGRTLLGADAEHRTRRRHFAQDHQSAGPQAAERDRARAGSAEGHGRHPAHRRR